MKRIVVVACAIVASAATGDAAAPSCPSATSAAFLKLEGIRGESQDQCHSHEIELLTFQMGAGRGPFTVTKRIDGTTPALFEAAATGRHFKQAAMTVFSTSQGQGQWMTYTLADVLITSFKQSAGPEGREEIVLWGAKVQTGSQPASTSVQAARSQPIEVFLKVDGIAGGSQDSRHPGEIVALNVSNGVLAPPGGSRAQVLGVDILKNVDAASAQLMAASQTKKVLKNAVISLHASGSPTPLLTCKLTSVLVRGLSRTGGQEKLTLGFEMIEYSFPGGSGPSAPSRSGWNLKQNKKL